LICIFAYVCVLLCTSHWLYPCACCATAALPAAIAAEPTQLRACWFDSPILFTGRVTGVALSICCFENNRANYALSNQMLNEDLQCHEFGEMLSLEIVQCILWQSFGDSRWEWEPKHRSRTAELFYIFSCLHGGTAVGCRTNNTLIVSNSSTSSYDYWCQASPTVRRLTYDASGSCHRFRLLCCLHNASVACHWLHYLGDILGFILSYRPIFPVYLLVFP